MDLGRTPKHLLGAAGVLDVDHAREHVVATGTLLFGDSAAATAWSENANPKMLSEGWMGMDVEFEEAACCLSTMLPH